jgi:hypothetical protein
MSASRANEEPYHAFSTIGTSVRTITEDLAITATRRLGLCVITNYAYTGTLLELLAKEAYARVTQNTICLGNYPRRLLRCSLRNGRSPCLWNNTGLRRRADHLAAKALPPSTSTRWFLSVPIDIVRRIEFVFAWALCLLDCSYIAPYTSCASMYTHSLLRVTTKAPSPFFSGPRWRSFSAHLSTSRCDTKD